MGRRLLIVDGSNLLFQMFFGMPSRIVNQQGKAIQGTLGFVGALRKIILMTAPACVAVLFDGGPHWTRPINPTGLIMVRFRKKKIPFPRLGMYIRPWIIWV